MYSAFCSLGDPEVAERLLPVVRGDGVEGFGIVGLDPGPLFEGVDRQIEIPGAVVEAGQLQVDHRVVRAQVPDLQHDRFGVFEQPRLFVEVREGEVVVRVLGVLQNHLAQHGFRARGIVRLVRPVGCDQVLHRQPLQVRVGNALRGQCVVPDGVFQESVVLRFAPARRLVQIVVRIGHVEVRSGELLVQQRVACADVFENGQDFLVVLDRPLVVAAAVSSVRFPERPHGAHLLQVAARDQWGCRHGRHNDCREVASDLHPASPFVPGQATGKRDRPEAGENRASIVKRKTGSQETSRVLP